MELLIVIGAVVVIGALVMGLKKVLHLTAEDENLSEKDDYLERRVQKDEEDK